MCSKLSHAFWFMSLIHCPIVHTLKYKFIVSLNNLAMQRYAIISLHTLSYSRLAAGPAPTRLRHKDVLHQPHYRDRLRDKRFKGTEFADMFKSFETSGLILWRWTSLITCAKAVKRRKGPLQLCWDMDKYMASAAANPDEQVPGPGAGNKTDALRLFDKAVHDKFFWAYLDPGFSLLYMLPLILWWF